jgi:hypothetical protein
MLSEALIMRVMAEESLLRLRTLKPDSGIQAAAIRAAQATDRACALKVLGVHTLKSGIGAPILAFERDMEIRGARLARGIDADAERPLAGIPAAHHRGTSRSRHT